MIKCLFIDSEYCSMGRWISLIVADAMDMKFYETKDLLKLAEENWLTEEYLRDFDERIVNMKSEELRNNPEFIRIHAAISKIILAAVNKGPCIIHERAAADIVKREQNFINVMIYNSGTVTKLKRARLEYDQHSDEKVYEFIKNEDMKRSIYHNAVSNSPWGAKETYDLCLDSEKLGREKCAEILINALKAVYLDEEYCKEVILKSFDKVI